MLTNSEFTEGNFFSAQFVCGAYTYSETWVLHLLSPAAFSKKTFIKEFHCWKTAAEQAQGAKMTPELGQSHTSAGLPKH